MKRTAQTIKMDNQKKTILIIDDNEDILFMLSDTLNKSFEVLCVQNSNDALDLLKKHNVHLIVSDVMMPGMDGFELCEKIKSDFETSHVPVILLTAKNSIQSKVEGLNVGADVYIEKPFSMEFLIAQIKSLLKNRDKINVHFVKSPTAHATSIASNEMDRVFLETLDRYILENMSNPDLDVQHLARHMNMSRTSLYRKISSLSNLSPLEIINLTRLKKAIEILSMKSLRLSEVIDIVGYTSLTQFGRNFQKHFGTTPSEFIKKELKRR